jgi:hypothetical protein
MNDLEPASERESDLLLELLNAKARQQVRHDVCVSVNPLDENAEAILRLELVQVPQQHGCCWSLVALAARDDGHPRHVVTPCSPHPT